MSLRINGEIDEALVDRIRTRLFEDFYRDPKMGTMTFEQVNAVAFTYALWLTEGFPAIQPK